MRNYPLNYNLKGGKSETKIMPTGGFPPIFICDEKDTNKESDIDPSKVKRELETHKGTVRLQDIMKKRKVTPFI